jgi:hypothetical protein
VSFDVVHTCISFKSYIHKFHHQLVALCKALVVKFIYAYIFHNQLFAICKALVVEFMYVCIYICIYIYIWAMLSSQWGL